MRILLHPRQGHGGAGAGKSPVCPGGAHCLRGGGRHRHPPQKLLDLLIIAPCTGNTLGKLAAGVTDTSVTMAAKAHLRNGRPLLLALSTNDGLAASAASIGALLPRKYIYFVPFGQDDFEKKPTSLVADFSQVADAAAAALEGRQLQPILLKA